MTQINILKIKNNANNFQALSFTCNKGQNVSVFSQGQGCNKNNQESKSCNGLFDNIFNMNPQDQASNNPMEKFFKAFLMGFMASLFGGMKNNQQKNNDNNNSNNILALINMPNEQKDDKCKMSKGFDFSQIEEAFKSLQNQGNQSKTTNYVFHNGVLSHANRPESSSCGCSGTQPQLAEQNSSGCSGAQPQAIEQNSSGCSGAQPQATEQNSSGFSSAQPQVAEQKPRSLGVSDFNVQDVQKAVIGKTEADFSVKNAQKAIIGNTESDFNVSNVRKAATGRSKINVNKGSSWRGNNYRFEKKINLKDLSKDGTGVDRTGNLASFKDEGLKFNKSSFKTDFPYARKDAVEALKSARDEIKEKYGKGADFRMTGGFGGAHQSKEHTEYGTAVDVVPSGKITYKQLNKILEEHGFASNVHDVGKGRHNHAVLKGDYNKYKERIAKAESADKDS